ncbi:MAG: VCBS repeat-containing protein [Acidobacteria bacterium]|nr:VCBS repeat-containing protein [Acidobacteriota bacterium]
MPRLNLKSRWFYVIVLLAAIAGSSYFAAPRASAATDPCATPYFKRVNGIFLGYIGQTTRALVHRAAFGDFNNDGKQDLVLLQLNPKTAYVFPGLGGGQFGSSVGYAVGDVQSTPSDVHIGDVNGDGKLDIIVYNSGDFHAPFNTCTSTVSTLFGDGLGGFATPVTASAPACTLDVEVADMNSDGKTDLVLGAGMDTRMLVGTSDGTGGFALAYFSTGSGAPGVWKVGDFNGDNKPDVVIGTSDPSTFLDRKLSLMLNNGSGGLTAPALITALDFLGRLAAGDLNLDGKTDLVMETSTTMRIMLGNGMGGFTTTTFAVPEVNGENLAIADFNGDGKPDIARSGLILQGNGTGGFTATNTYPPGFPSYFQTADLNGDGRADLANYSVDNLLTTPFGFSFYLSVCNLVNDTSRLDYDGDRKTDVAVWSPGTGQWLIRNSSNGSTRMQTWGLGSLGDKPAPGDYDGDGKTDLAVFRTSDSTWYILNSADNTFRAQFWGASGDKPVAADYDGDGKTDIAVFRPSNGGWYALRSSDNTLYAVGWGTSGDKPVPEDYDGDDKADIAVFRPSNGAWYIYRSSDNSYVALLWGLSTDVPMSGDFDGDGKADLLVYRSSGSGGIFWLRRSFNGAAQAIFGTGQVDQPITGDFDGDGITDLTLRPTSGGFWQFLNSGSVRSNIEWGMPGDVQATSAYPIE